MFYEYKIISLLAFLFDNLNNKIKNDFDDTSCIY